MPLMPGGPTPPEEVALVPTAEVTAFGVNSARMPDGTPLKVVHVELAIDIPLNGDAARGMADALMKGLIDIARVMPPGPQGG